MKLSEITQVKKPQMRLSDIVGNEITPSISSEREITPLLPKQQEVEYKISKRPDSVSQFIEEVKTPPKIDLSTPGNAFKTFFSSGIMKPALTVAKGINIPFQRGEAALASGGLAAQRGAPPMEVIREAFKGITGKRPAELGDIIRTTGVGGSLNEPIASATGLAAMTGVGNLLTKGQLGEDIRKTSIQGKEMIKGKLPKIMNADYTLKQAETLADDAKALRAGFGSLKEDMLNKVGSVGVNEEKFYKIFNVLPEEVVKKFDDPIYNITRNQAGGYNTTINNLDSMREAIGDLLSSKEWIEASKSNKILMKNVFNQLGDLMKNASSDVAPALDAYANFMKSVYRPVEKILLRTGSVVEKPLRGALIPGAERSTQKSLDALGRLSKDSAQALKNMRKFLGRQFAKKAIGVTAGLGTLAGAGKWVIGKALNTNTNPYQ